MTHKFKVLQVVSNLFHGGAQRMAVHLACAIDYQQFEVELISLFDPGTTDLESILEESNIPVTFLSKRPGLDLRMFKRLSEQLQRYQPDVIHIHHNLMRYCFPVTLLHQVPVCIHTVHSLAHKDGDRLERLIKRIAYPNMFVPVSIADSVTQSLKDYYGLEHITEIPNGIPTSLLKHPILAKADWRKEADIALDDLLLVSVGRLDAAKNYPLLLQAFAEIASDYPKAKLLIAGEGEHRELLESMIQEHSLQNQARLLGNRNDIRDMLHAADIFVSSSAWEGNPLSVMEALATGTPVIATEVGGIPQLVMQGETGLLVPGDADHKQLAAAIQTLLTNPDQRLKMGQAAMQIAEEKFDVRVMAQRYEQLYLSHLT